MSRKIHNQLTADGTIALLAWLLIGAFWAVEADRSCMFVGMVTAISEITQESSPLKMLSF